MGHLQPQEQTPWPLRWMVPLKDWPRWSRQKRLPRLCVRSHPTSLTLTQDTLLERCLHGGSQNTNESFHNMIWERCPKTTFVGRKRLCLAVADATIVYNDGELGRLNIFHTLGMEPGLRAQQCFAELDKKRLRVIGSQIQASEAKKFARHHQALTAAEQEGDTEQDYLAGGHEWVQKHQIHASSWGKKVILNGVCLIR